MMNRSLLAVSLLAAVAVVAAVAAGPARAATTAAAGPVALGPDAGKFGDWTAASYGSGGSKACYAFTTATGSAPKLAGRGAVMLTVTERGANRNEVTIAAGYVYPAKPTVTLTVGSQSFSFYTKGSTAFTTAGGTAIAAFQAGSTATASGTGPGGKTVVDTFSLTGFSGAYKAIDAACS